MSLAEEVSVVTDSLFDKPTCDQENSSFSQCNLSYGNSTNFESS